MSKKAQEYLNENYPKKIRNSIKNLLLRDKNLEGHLDLKDFTNLEKLDCSYNQITSLDLNGLKHLKVLYANDNCLESLDYSSLDPQKLTGLIIDNNNLPEQDIAVFSDFNNLEDLRIGSDDKGKIEQDIYNRFSGSLESLKKLTRLEDLGINNTDISSGVECLPSSVGKIRYSTTRPESKVKAITEELNSFLNRETNENWQEIHPDFTEWKERGWKDNYFSYQETKGWIAAGLTSNDYHLAAYLRVEGYHPNSKINFEELKKEDRSAQNYLDKEYPLEAREWVNWLDISRSGLTGDLVLENWFNLERLDCYNNWLTSLTIVNCPKLTRIECSNNKITSIVINNCLRISVLNVSDNLLTDLDFLTNLNPQKIIVLYITNNDFAPQDVSIFSKFVNLKYLYLANNNFIGNLQSLKDLTKLEKLGITGTKINEDLEYLPDDLKEVALVSEQKIGKSTSGFKVVRWTNLLKEKEYHNVAYYDLQYWKEAQPAFQKLKETWEKLHPGQSIWNFLRKENIFFNVRLGNFQAQDCMLISFLKKDWIISEKEAEIIRLKNIITEISGLQKSINEQKELIDKKIQSYPSEKELLEEFVKVYVEFKKMKNKKIFDRDELDKLEKKYNDIYDKIKLRRSVIREIEEECDKLVKLEADISKFREQSKQMVNIMITNSSISVEQGNLLIGNTMGNNANLSYRNLANTSTGLTKQFKRQYSLSAETQNKSKEIKLDQTSKLVTEPEIMEIDSTNDWTNIHSNFTPELVHQWQSHDFTSNQVRDWINIGLTPTDADFCTWLRDIKQLDTELALNHGNMEELRVEYQVIQQLQAQQEITPKK